MCRFFSMFHHKHPALEGYDWIFRLDEGITFHCELVRPPLARSARRGGLQTLTRPDRAARGPVPDGAHALPRRSLVALEVLTPLASRAAHRQQQDVRSVPPRSPCPPPSPALPDALLSSPPRAGFTNVDQEAQFVIPTLWKTATAFMRDAPRHYFPAGRDESFVSDDGGKTYNHRVRRSLFLLCAGERAKR